MWPDAPEDLLEQCNGAGLTDEDIDKISWQNVARFCSYDPFAVIPEDDATVGALRASSPDVDTSEVTRQEWRARYEANPPSEVASALPLFGEEAPTLPPGPRTPRLLQSLQYALRPYATVLSGRRFGDRYTVAALTGPGKMVVFSDPDAIRDIFSGDGDILVGPGA